MYNIDGLLPPPLFFMSSFSISIKRSHPFLTNKLAKARMTRKSPSTLGLNKFGPGKLWFEKVWAQNIFINLLGEPNDDDCCVLHAFLVWQSDVRPSLQIIKFPGIDGNYLQCGQRGQWRGPEGASW